MQSYILEQPTSQQWAVVLNWPVEVAAGSELSKVALYQEISGVAMEQYPRIYPERCVP